MVFIRIFGVFMKNIKVSLLILLFFYVIPSTVVAADRYWIFDSIHVKQDDNILLSNWGGIDIEGVSNYFAQRPITLTEENYLITDNCKQQYQIMANRIDQELINGKIQVIDEQSLAYRKDFFQSASIDVNNNSPIEYLFLKDASECRITPFAGGNIYIYNENLLFNYGLLTVKYKLNPLFNISSISPKVPILPSSYPHICYYYEIETSVCHDRYPAHKLYQTLYYPEKKIEYTVLLIEKESQDDIYIVFAKSPYESPKPVMQFIPGENTIDFTLDNAKLIVSLKHDAQLLDTWVIDNHEIYQDGTEISKQWPWNDHALSEKLYGVKFEFDAVQKRFCRYYMNDLLMDLSFAYSCKVDKPLLEAYKDFAAEKQLIKFPEKIKLNENKVFNIKDTLNEYTLTYKWKSDHEFTIMIGSAPTSDKIYFSELNNKTVLKSYFNYLEYTP